MKSLEILYLLMLQLTEGIGDLSAKKLISYCGSAQAVIEEKPYLLEKIPGIGSQIIKKAGWRQKGRRRKLAGQNNRYSCHRFSGQ